MSSILPPLWVAPAALAVVAIVLRAPSFRGFAEAQPSRFGSLDGLRGILAFGVFAHHFAITMQWQRLGVWDRTPSVVWNLMGEAAVVLFFMITGFLFFRKMRASPNGIDLRAFYRGRLLRIYPVFLCMTGAVLVLGALLGHIGFPGLHLALREGYHWLTFRPEALFGYDDADAALAHVPWTLRYEILFYLLLPLVYAAWRAVAFRLWPLVLLCLVGLALAYHPLQSTGWMLTTLYAAPFTLGGLVGLLAERAALRRALGGWWGLVLCLLALGATVLTSVTAYTPLAYLLLALVFLPIAIGNSMGGLLVARPIRILGTVSYDLYLVHGFVLYVAFQILWPTGLSSRGPAALGAMVAVLVPIIALSLALHRFVERPAMRIAQRRRGPRIVDPHLAAMRPAPIRS